ncbi:hypothetical protein [Bradyrhizobium sp. JYMT SZCCT0428]|uniref:hypothetical protein n=1 Tax=Bradyrhizobium sp. JYMT SZCCT0428 TaxID=2807673 RepID=UPI001BA4FE75|nr:hypothetical protein [Bradyrhizobium sp. JYMT SZCCT0428]MBR1154188.1 hypothetical protein [Bradyrhizobium sp. JYMT SZCCT0428]
MTAKEQHEHRVHAIQVVAALPNDPEDALLVLRAAERLVRGFLTEPEPVKAAQIVVQLRQNVVTDCSDRSA